MNDGCANHTVLDVGDSIYDIKTTVVFLPNLELKYIENDDFVCGFYNDEVEKPFMKNGKTEMIRPYRVVIALDTSTEAIEELLLQDQVSFKNFKTQNDFNIHDLSRLISCQAQYYIQLLKTKRLVSYGRFTKTTETSS